MKYPLLMAIAFGISVIGVFLTKRASLEGKFILVFAILSLGAFFRLYHYLLLLVSLSLFAFVGVALLWAWLGSTRVTVKRKVKKEAMAGESIPVEYEITSRSPLPLFHVRIWDKIFRERSDGSHDELFFEDPGYLGILRVAKKEKFGGTLHFVPPMRGILELGPVAIEGSDPFGIFVLVRWVSIGEECLVLPSWVRLAGLPSVPARLGAREHEHLVSKEGHSHEFLGIRPYSEGDSLRGVHWPLTAKHDELIVRQYQKEVEEEVLIILDADRESDVGEGAENALEYAITIALSLANVATEMGRPWTLVTVGKNVETISHKTKEAILLAQHSLAKLKADREVPIETVIDDVRKEFPDAGCLLVTARTDNTPAEALAEGDLRMGGEIKSLVIRVDSSTFTPRGEDGLKMLRQKRKPAERQELTAFGDRKPVNELVVSQGDDLGDVFIDRSFA